MDNIENFCKRNLPKRIICRHIYIFYYDDSKTLRHLNDISNELSNMHSPWSLRHYAFQSNITYHEILKKINTPYHKYDKSLDKICIIYNNNLYLKNAKLTIEYFSDICNFKTWLTTFQTS